MQKPATSRLALSILVALAAALGSFGCPDNGVPNGHADIGPHGDATVPGALTLTPQDPVVNIKAGAPMPTVQFVAKLNGVAVTATFTVSPTTIGTISGSGLFTPAGTEAGVANVSATANALTAKTTVTVKIESGQNGSTDPYDGGFGPGGYRGVGGEGPGRAVSDPIKAILDGPPKAEPSLAFLYPYDQTVWPLGQLAPLLQWTADAALLNAADGAVIQLTTTNYQYKGYFGRPMALAAGAPFQRHPIPQEVWDAATRSGAGDTLQVQLAISSGGKALGPISETWKIAKGELKGIVYYQSYGTNLAKNLAGAKPDGRLFGGATLAIKPGNTDPVLIAGKDGNTSACRVCHSVSSDGSRMVVQHGENYSVTSSYDLKNGNQEVALSADLKFAGLSPDGTLGLTNWSPAPFDGASATLYDIGKRTEVASTGLKTFVNQASLPSFSPDGKHVAFGFWSGPGNADLGAGDGSRLVVMSFDQATSAFSAPKGIYKGTPQNPPAWASFLPASDAVVFEVILGGNASELFATRYGAKGELWWADVATANAHKLDAANGRVGGNLSVPKGPAHGDDSVLNYEPTVCPLPSGGYAWVVFMSRRLYGNVATVDPWWSDPRDQDLTVTPTPKKLWVAAMDLTAKPGTDASHPAFYLPAQEILAGNSRGFWVFEACRPDDAACDSGDQCCGGYCLKAGELGGTCSSQKPVCSKEYDKCSTVADCCSGVGLDCVNSRCVYTGPN